MEISGGCALLIVVMSGVFYGAVSGNAVLFAISLLALIPVTAAGMALDQWERRRQR